MDSLFATRQTLLTILNDELNTQYDRLADAFSDWRQRQSQEEQADAVGVCGFPCMGDCQTCTQSNADLDAFFGAPAEVVVVVAEEPAPIISEASASVEGHAAHESQTSVLEAAEALDGIEEAQRSGEAFDQGDEDCECLECRTGYNPELWFDDREDDRYDNCGLDWNESGYFD
jgi:hypothetical protein